MNKLTHLLTKQRGKQYRATLPTLYARIARKLEDIVHQRTYVAVGDILANNVWGSAWSKIEVLSVSEDKREFQYKFLTCQGMDIWALKEVHTMGTGWLCDHYNIIRGRSVLITNKVELTTSNKSSIMEWISCKLK